MKKFKRQKGITLIALVITIIILLILAGVALSIVFNGGIIDKSQNAVDSYDYASKNEAGKISSIEKQMDDYFNDRQGLYSVTIIKGEGIETATESGTVAKGSSMNLSATKKSGVTGDIFWKVTQGNFKDVANTTSAETTVTPTSSITIEVSAISHDVYTAIYQVGNDKVLVYNNVPMTSSYTYPGGTFIKAYDENLKDGVTPIIWYDSYELSYKTDNITKVDIVNDIYPNSLAGYFLNLENVTVINNLDKIKTDYVTSVSDLFGYCCKLSGKLDLSNWNMHIPLNIDMQEMFYYCSELEEINISGWNVSLGYGSFSCCDNLKKLNISGNKINCTLQSIGCLEELDVTNCEVGSNSFDGYLFTSNSYLRVINGIETLDTSNVTNMQDWFDHCDSLTSLDLSNWDTSNVTNMSNMFSSTYGLISLDLRGWNTSNVTNMSNMFGGCDNLTSLDLRGWNTSNVTNMSNMFSGCDNLTSLDLSNWDTSNVTDMSGMFDHCYYLEKIYVGNGWNISNLTNSYNMFCSNMSLVGGAGTKWEDVFDSSGKYYDSSKTDKDYAHVDGGASNPGLFTLGPAPASN